MTIIKIGKVHRNNPCNCGSGKKSKNCCKGSNEYEYIKNSPEDIEPVDNNTENGDNA